MKDFRILPQLVIVANCIVVEKSGNYISEVDDKGDEVASEAEMSKIYASFPLNIYS